jgi:uncharacterized protein (DUF1810 family)
VEPDASVTESTAGLDRFVAAQDAVWPRVLAELGAGAKRSHWMWFVFPQVAGLGFSAMSQRFALASVDEARAYLAHPLLGARLRQATGLMLAHRGRPAESILGPVEALKLRSSMTLFQVAAPGEACFGAALDAFFAGAPDLRTLERVGR